MPSTAELQYPQPTPDTQTALVALLVNILRPLVVLMLRQGLTAYEFAEVTRWVYAHAAMDRKQFAVRGRDVWSMTKSRAAVLTGLTRREVDRLLGMQAPAVDEARESFHRGTRILNAWLKESGYQDRNGRPRDLPVKGPQGSLEWLVRRYCRDIPLRAMLDELIDRGCVERVEHDRVRLVHADTSGPALSCEDLDRIGRQAGQFMMLLGTALAGEAEPHFVEITAGPMAAEHRQALNERITETVSAFALQMKREISAHPKSLLADQDDHMLIGFYNGFI